MSKELEMLREMAKQIPETAPFVRCPKCDTAQEVYTHIDDRMVNAADLRAILARLEAAELVCESAVQYSVEGSMLVFVAVNKEALRAYRDLDAPKQEKP